MAKVLGREHRCKCRDHMSSQRLGGVEGASSPLDTLTPDLGLRSDLSLTIVLTCTSYIVNTGRHQSFVYPRSRLTSYFPFEQVQICVEFLLLLTAITRDIYTPSLPTRPNLVATYDHWWLFWLGPAGQWVACNIIVIWFLPTLPVAFRIGYLHTNCYNVGSYSFLLALTQICAKVW